MLYKKEIQEMATTVKTCKYDPEVMVQKFALGALGSNKQAISREIAGSLDDMEAPESY